MLIQSVLSLILIGAASAQPQTSDGDSPCPPLFFYENNNDGKGWYGVLNVEKLLSKNVVHIDIEITATTPGNVFNDSRIDLEGSVNEITHNIESGHSIRYIVTLPSQIPLATITAIAINGIQICAGPPPKGVIENYLSTVTLRHQVLIPQKPTLYSPPTPSRKNICQDGFESLFCFLTQSKQQRLQVNPDTPVVPEIPVSTEIPTIPENPENNAGPQQ